MSADKTKVAAILLLADDSTTIQRVIELTFADEDVRVIVVNNGDAAILRVEKQPPDIVLADVGLPGKNGYDVASYIKHTSHLSHIPVLLLTGAFEPVDQHKANDAGCDGVLTKPLEPQLVISRVKELLERARGAGPAGPIPLSAPTPERAAPPPPARADGASAPTESLGDFFDKLDAAFANLPAARSEEMPVPEARRGAGEPGGTPGRSAVAPVSTHQDGDWDIDLHSTPDIGLPSFLAPTEEAGSPSSGPGSRPAAARPATGPPSAVPSTAAEAQSMPHLAEAFAALLDAEQSGGPVANVVAWARPPIVTDDLVERVAMRVLERLSDRIVRETVRETLRETSPDLVSSIAERLVREEISRIKAAIKNL